jgi:hypothetical protein
MPVNKAFIKYWAHQAPGFLGAWCLIGIVAASMSTASGAILAMGTVSSHNVMRQLDNMYPELVTDRNSFWQLVYQGDPICHGIDVDLPLLPVLAYHRISFDCCV